MPHGITQCCLPPGRGDIPALTPARLVLDLATPEGCKAELCTEEPAQLGPNAVIGSLRLLPAVRQCSVLDCRERSLIWQFSSTFGGGGGGGGGGDRPVPAGISPRETPSADSLANERREESIDHYRAISINLHES